MTALLLIKTIHYLCLSALLYSSAMKNWLLWPASMTQLQLIRVRRFDKLSGAAAGVILLSGLTMLLWFAKPTSYYITHPLFALKLVIFVVASGLIVLTKIACKHALNSAEALWIVPRKVKAILMFDFVGLLMMAILGYFVAHP